MTNPSRNVTWLAAWLGFALLGQAGPGVEEGRPPPPASVTAPTVAIAASTTAATATSVRFIPKVLRLHAPRNKRAS